MRRVAVAALLLGLLAGCASPGARPPGDGDARRSSPATDADWKTYQADVTEVRRIPGESTSVRLTVSMLAGAEGCSRNPQIGYHTEENGMIYANVTQDSRRAGEVGVCLEKTSGQVLLTSKTPIGNRKLVLNQEAWKPSGSDYAKCSKTMGCDPPPADHCDPFWIQLAVQGMDVSRHSMGHKEACENPWLVMTVPDDPAPCGAEPRDGCDPTTTTRRYFLHFEPAGWQIQARATGPGCTGAPPAFPHKLCENLPVA